jgi:uridine kinase
MTRTAGVAAAAAAVTALEARPARVAVDGIDCAGKTTFADALAAALASSGRPVIRACVDDFLRPKALRYRRGGLSAEGYYRDSFDRTALRRALLDPLGPGGDRRYRAAVFDAAEDRPLSLPPETAPEDAVLLVDGVFLQHPDLRGAWDLVIWMDVSFDEALRRARRRDAARFGADVAERYTTRYLPGQAIYLSECRPAETADLVV